MEENTQKREITEEFLKHETNTELDAIHPRFMEPQNAQVIREYEIKHHYYCDLCKIFFAPTFKGLKVHFSGDMVQHQPYASCFYCQGNVYEYKFNNERKLYHNCNDHRRNNEENDSD